MSRASAANLQCLNPGFEYRFFDDADVAAFVKEEFPQYEGDFNAFPIPIQRVDFFRYLAVYRLGGFYFDLDVFLTASISELRGSACVFPFEELTVNRYLRQQHNMDWELGNYAFGATAGHPFLEALIVNCIRALKEPEWVEPMMRGIPRWLRSSFFVLNTTGPGMLSRTFAEHPGLAREITVLFPDDVCDSGSWHQFGRFGVHAMEGSWRTAGGYLRRRLTNLWEARASRKGMKESRLRGKKRALPANACLTTEVEA
jgi:hypothetical protein